MTKKYAAEYRKQKRAEQAAQISSLDREMLDLMRRLRRHTYCSALGSDPRSLALQQLMKAIDAAANVVTGDPEYFHAKHQSIG